MIQPLREHDASRDFDFLHGPWRVHHRRLRARLAGSGNWEEFEGRAEVRPLPDRLGNQDQASFDVDGPVIGLSFRFFDAQRQTWSIYWIDSRHRRLDPPVVGGFAGGRGVFFGDDVFDGRPIRFRFIWSRIETPQPRWEQAFSDDGGAIWETNWVMDFEREQASR
jgi:hypothetical protein